MNLSIGPPYLLLSTKESRLTTPIEEAEHNSKETFPKQEKQIFTQLNRNKTALIC